MLWAEWPDEIVGALEIWSDGFRRSGAYVRSFPQGVDSVLTIFAIIGESVGVRTHLDNGLHLTFEPIERITQ